MKAGSSIPMSQRLPKYAVDIETGCWNWLGSKDRDGYGRMIGGLNGRRIFSFAHRNSLNITFEPSCRENKFIITVITRAVSIQNIFMLETRLLMVWIRKNAGGLEVL